MHISRNVIWLMKPPSQILVITLEIIPGLPKLCKSVHLSAARTVPLMEVSEQVWNNPSWWYCTPSISLSSFHQTRQKSVQSAKIPSRIAAKQLTKLVITLIMVLWRRSCSQSFAFLLRSWVCQLICEEFAANCFIEMHACHLCSLHFTHNNVLRLILKLTVRCLISYSDYHVLTDYLTEFEWN